MNQPIDAIYENGIFRPIDPKLVHIPEGQVVRIMVSSDAPADPIKLATEVYEGLSNEVIDEVERIALDRRSFFGTKGAK